MSNSHHRIAVIPGDGVGIEVTTEAVKVLDAVARLAAEVNRTVENIGARRLHTVMERLLEEISFTASDRGGETVTVDESYVSENVAELAKNTDLSKFIL